MKKTIRFKTIAVLFFLIISFPAAASIAPADIPVNTEERAVQLQTRLEEIKAVDKESISRAEKKALRREVREIKKELAAIGGGVYLSVGAIIIIALLLILLL